MPSIVALRIYGAKQKTIQASHTVSLVLTDPNASNQIFIFVRTASLGVMLPVLVVGDDSIVTAFVVSVRFHSMRFPLYLFSFVCFVHPATVFLLCAVQRCPDNALDRREAIRVL
mmetsp:Transcript_15185/g.31269  ORF Transcript_15185/g.31269 Transcript_15185/m.31269 type:complete len:114 (+) Transcript_15185:174-515(+)